MDNPAQVFTCEFYEIFKTTILRPPGNYFLLDRFPIY